MAAGSRQVQRRTAGPVFRVDVRAVLEQTGDEPVETTGSCRMQQGVAAGTDGVGAGATRNQLIDEALIPGARGAMQHFIDRVGVSRSRDSIVDEQLDELSGTVLDRDIEGRAAVIIGRVCVGACCEQRPRGLE